MSSTDAARLKRFFHRRLVPAASRMAARGVRYFPTGSEPEASTWYVPGPGPDTEVVDLDDVGIVASLAPLWQEHGLDELVALAQPLEDLARKLERRPEAAADVSPFVYVMY